jgi:hypothetical protein
MIQQTRRQLMSNQNEFNTKAIELTHDDLESIVGGAVPNKQKPPGYTHYVPKSGLPLPRGGGVGAAKSAIQSGSEGSTSAAVIGAIIAAAAI